MASSASFGIVSLAHALGRPMDVKEVADQYVDDVERVQGWGYRTMHRADDGVGVTALATEAGERALRAAGVTADQVDLVVLAVSDVAEYLYWDAAGATQAALGAHRAEAVLLNQACGGGVAAFDVVAGKFATHEDYRLALIIGANRVCEPYWNRMDTNANVYSDGAAAALVERDHTERRWLVTEIISDGRYADFTRMDVGGTSSPFPADRSGQAAVPNAATRLDEFFGGDINRMLEFLDTIRARSHEVVEHACRRIGKSPADLSRVIHFNDNIQALTELATDLGMPAGRTNIDRAIEYGHVGCADQLLSLEYYVETEEVAPGDIVALTCMASGMHWLCTLLRI